MTRSRKLPGLHNGTILEAYWRGVAECRAGRPPRPPRDHTRQGYLNGFRDEQKFREAVHHSIEKAKKKRR